MTANPQSALDALSNFQSNISSGRNFMASSGMSKPANPSGIRPVEFKVVVYPKPVEEVTKGGIIRPTTTVDTDKYAMQEATIVAIADKAFSEADIWGSNPPTLGDVVLFAKYAGLLRKGADGKDYRVLNDKDVCAVLE